MQYHAIRRVISPTTRSYNLRVVVHDPFIRVMLQDDALIGVILQREMRGVMIATIHAMC